MGLLVTSGLAYGLFDFVGSLYEAAESLLTPLFAFLDLLLPFLLLGVLFYVEFGIDRGEM